MHHYAIDDGSCYLPTGCFYGLAKHKVRACAYVLDKHKVKDCSHDLRKHKVTVFYCLDKHKVKCKLMFPRPCGGKAAGDFYGLSKHKVNRCFSYFIK